MPATITPGPSGITKLTNCRLLRGTSLEPADLYLSAASGKIVDAQAAFYDSGRAADTVIDMRGRIVAPGLIDVQLNGAFGFNFSTLLDDDAVYAKKMRAVNAALVKTGVTAYVPTLTSQLPEVYHHALPHLAPSGAARSPADGAESLGAHVEGPFLSRAKNGVHNRACLRTADDFSALEACYGAANLARSSSSSSSSSAGGVPDALGRPRAPAIRMITAAPEEGAMADVIRQVVARGIVFSIGHSAATYAQAQAAVEAGAGMVTHLFNAMMPLHHREPGIVGVLAGVGGRRKPCYGVIADGVHLHPATVALAYKAHPEGFILVTDAMHLVGCPDGKYEFRNGEEVNNMVKIGPRLLLEGTETIAGSSITLLECVNNFIAWTGASIGEALNAVTATPAAMLGLAGIKGGLTAGADADLVVFSEDTRTVDGEESVELVLDEVWKFGERVV